MKHDIKDLLADGTHFWGVCVERVEVKDDNDDDNDDDDDQVKDVRVPEQLMRAMAAEAEAAREARAKVTS